MFVYCNTWSLVLILHLKIHWDQDRTIHFLVIYFVGIPSHLVKTLGGCLVMGLINTEQIKKQQYRFHSLGAVFSKCLLDISIWTSNTDDN